MKLAAEELRELFVRCGYNVTTYSDDEIWTALGIPLTNTRRHFGVDDVRAAFDRLRGSRAPER